MNTPSAEDIAAQLGNLKSLITHAHEIEENGEALVRAFKEHYIDSRNYQVEASLAANLKHLREILAESYDYRFREFSITAFNRKAAVIFLEGMADKELINTHIIGKLMLPPVAGLAVSPQEDEVAYLKSTLLTAAAYNEVTQMDQAVKQLASGDTLLLVDGVASIIMVESRKMESRVIAEPDTESNVLAARDGFVERLQVNLSLLRRRIKNPNLIAKRFTIGTRSNTDLVLIYFRGIANPRLVEEVEQRLRKIKIDAPVGAGFIQGLIEDHPYSLFPTMLVTERPDKFVAALVEGKVGIILDGQPFGILAPATLPEFFQTSDDYNEKWMVSSLIRFTRYFSALFAIATPAIFVAVTTFHPGLLPGPLAITIAVARLGIPFPAVLEALVMTILLEILQEAGLRLPKTIGSAVSIVGGLVIGEATVRAGLISAPMVIVIAFTAIVSFNVANYRINLIVRLIRIPLMFLGATLGMLGVMVGLLAMIAHLSMIESFGVPYMAPVAPKRGSHLSDYKDTVFVAPPSFMDKRPAYLSPGDVRRQGKSGTEEESQDE